MKHWRRLVSLLFTKCFYFEILLCFKGTSWNIGHVFEFLLIYHWISEDIVDTKFSILSTCSWCIGVYCHVGTHFQTCLAVKLPDEFSIRLKMRSKVKYFTFHVHVRCWNIARYYIMPFHQQCNFPHLFSLNCLLITINVFTDKSRISVFSYKL